MAKIIVKGEEAQKRVIEGVVDIVDAIKTTIGPAGKCVAIENTMIPPEITRDGATVAKSVSFLDGAKNIGAQLVKKAATLTEDEVGDATSNTSLLIKELCIKGQKALSVGANVNELKSGMLKAADWVKEFIKKNSISVDGDLEKIRRVATISANNDPEVGNLIIKSMEKVGIDGTITADLSGGLDTVVDITEGMKIERGWSMPGYVTNEAEGICLMEDCSVVVCGDKLTSVQQIVPLIECITSNMNKPFLLICDGIDDSVNTMLMVNNMRGAIKCCVIKDIDFGDNRVNLMQDIATKTGATYFCPGNSRDITSVTIDDIGHAGKIVIARDSTIIYDPSGNPETIEKRADILRSLLSKSDQSDYNKTKFSKRLANLTKGIAVIKAGGATEVEKVNRKQTIEDAILASKSAISEGVVAGGGYIYYKASLVLENDKSFWKDLVGNEKDGARILIESLSASIRTIAENSGSKSDIVLDTVEKNISKRENYGYNAKTKKFVNLVEDGVLDSAKAIRVALENATSTASMILTIDCILLDEDEKNSTDK